MVDLDRVFGWVCGRAHLWAPGGEALPFCQRCTGLYVGAAMAVALYWVLRPRPTRLLLWGHGFLLLVMLPFGYHLAPQNGVIRTLTGQLFALGLVSYLSLLPLGSLGMDRGLNRRAGWAYVFGAAASLAALQWAVSAENPAVGRVLPWLGLAGLTALALANLVLVPATIWRLVHPARASTSP